MLLSARNGYEADSAQQPVATPTAEQDRPVSRNESHKTHTAFQQPAPLKFRKAVKYDAKLRLAICGPSGSGKTYTLLQLATELGGRVALIDTERGSASKYADIFQFDVLELESYDPARLIEIIDGAAGKGIEYCALTRCRISGTARTVSWTKWIALRGVCKHPIASQPGSRSPHFTTH